MLSCTVFLRVFFIFLFLLFLRLVGDGVHQRGLGPAFSVFLMIPSTWVSINILTLGGFVPGSWSFNVLFTG